MAVTPLCGVNLQVANVALIVLSCCCNVLYVSIFVCQQVQYVDGKQELLALRNKRVTWRHPYNAEYRCHLNCCFASSAAYMPYTGAVRGW
jgi:hypothetical protein